MEVIVGYIKDYFLFSAVFVLGFVACAILSINRQNREIRDEIKRLEDRTKSPAVVLPEYFHRANVILKKDDDGQISVHKFNA